MKKCLQTVLGLVAAVLIVVVAGCSSEPAPDPETDSAANPDMIMDMPTDPEAETGPAE